MSALQYRTLHSLTSTGAMIDPVFLRHAINDMVSAGEDRAQTTQVQRIRWRVLPARLAVFVRAALSRRGKRTL